MKEIGKVITLNEAAKILNVSYSTAVRLARSGQLAAFKATSKSWRTTDIACRNFIEQKFEETQTNIHLQKTTEFE